jgi:hypothetical protein
VEKYPPAINLLRLLGQTVSADSEIHLLTTGVGDGRENIVIPGVIIHRLGKWKQGMARFSRILFYIKFVFDSFFKLLRFKPVLIMYYETVSAGAPYFYKKLIKPSCPIFIHYHEYTSPGEYESGMILTRWLHRLELSLYKKANWVSHTNEDRMRLFLQDTGQNAPTHFRVLPNHPPALWSGFSTKNPIVRTKPTAFVYVGALSMETLYVREMAEWIARQPDECYWNIYSDNLAPGVLSFFDELGASNIFFKGAVKYDDLPGILSKHSVGVILYKGHIPNYIYNVPNKLFEYYTCNLDTWFPQQMVSCLPLVTQETFPKILALDFLHLDRLSLQELLETKNYRYQKIEYTCENTYSELIHLFNESRHN